MVRIWCFLKRLKSEPSRTRTSPKEQEKKDQPDNRLVFGIGEAVGMWIQVHVFTEQI